jgi:hypothetical protein
VLRTEPGAISSALDCAYASAMRDLHDRYPADLDAAALYAEALMDLRPWNYWTRDMQPTRKPRKFCVCWSLCGRAIRTIPRLFFRLSCQKYSLPTVQEIDNYLA